MIKISINPTKMATLVSLGMTTALCSLPVYLIWKEYKNSKKLKAYKEDKFKALGFDASKRIADASINNEFITDPKDKAFLKVSLDDLYDKVLKASTTKNFEESLETFIEYTDFLVKDENQAKTYLEYLRLMEEKLVITQERQFELDKLGAVTRPLVDALAYKIKWSH